MNITTSRLLLLLALLSGITCHSLAQVVSKEMYKAAGIPDTLKKNAHSVVRYSSDEILIKSVGKVISKHHSIVTILDEKAENEAMVFLHYDKKFNSINKAEMLVYGAEGNLIKKYKKSDFYDRSAVDGGSILTDNRILIVQHTISNYPITVEAIYEEECSGFLDLGSWDIQSSEQAVQFATYKVFVNPTLGFRFNNRNTSIVPTKASVENIDSYTWEAENLNAVKIEEAVPTWRVLPRIYFATEKFELDGLPGDLSTWKSFGDWFKELNLAGSSLSPERAAEIKQMTSSLNTDREKAEFLYNYLQKNTRYVSIQLGIGGLKPFPATFVDQKKYGDCKALSNYMSALLKAVNIPSHYAVVNARANAEPANPSFTNDPFNHIILCIPFKKDTTWLECTSTTQAFGKLGTFTENRNALLITEDGGKLVNTPRSVMEDHQFKSDVHLKLLPDGSATATLKINTTGEYRSMYTYVAELKVDDQKEFIIKALNLKQPSLLEIKHSSDKGGLKEMDIVLEYDKFVDMAAGNKLFYKPGLFSICQTTMPVLEKRKNDYYFENPMQEVSNTTIDLPEGFMIESMPANVNLKFSYGNFESTYAYDAAKNQLQTQSKFNLINHVIPAAKYSEMQVYFDNIAKANSKKLVIKKKS